MLNQIWTLHHDILNTSLVLVGGGGGNAGHKISAHSLIANIHCPLLLATHMEYCCVAIAGKVWVKVQNYICSSELTICVLLAWRQILAKTRNCVNRKRNFSIHATPASHAQWIGLLTVHCEVRCDLWPYWKHLKSSDPGKGPNSSGAAPAAYWRPMIRNLPLPQSLSNSGMRQLMRCNDGGVFDPREQAVATESWCAK